MLLPLVFALYPTVSTGMRKDRPLKRWELVATVAHTCAQCVVLSSCELSTGPVLVWGT